MFTGAAKLLIPLILLSNIACAEEPQAPIKALQGLDEANNGADEDHSDEKITSSNLMSLAFKGKDPFGTDCLLYISKVETTDEDHALIAQFGYNLHGETPIDSIVEFRRYNINNNTYYPVDSQQTGTTPSLVSAILDDNSMVVDYNKLVEYEQEGLLIQSVRADFFDMDFTLFKTSLDQVLSNSNQFLANKPNLDQLKTAVLKLSHAGHYDSVACFNFQLEKMEKVKFNLESDHNGDHDHDHDH